MTDMINQEENNAALLVKPATREGVLFPSFCLVTSCEPGMAYHHPNAAQRPANTGLSTVTRQVSSRESAHHRPVEMEPVGRSA